MVSFAVEFIVQQMFNNCAFVLPGIVHRDIKLENILMATNPENPNDKLHVKVSYDSLKRLCACHTIHVCKSWLVDPISQKVQL